jgi:hypothetical protein
MSVATDTSTLLSSWIAAQFHAYSMIFTSLSPVMPPNSWSYLRQQSVSEDAD